MSLGLIRRQNAARPRRTGRAMRPAFDDSIFQLDDEHMPDHDASSENLTSESEVSLPDSTDIIRAT